tara:strand:+ start:3123 stop:3503 length:381 start_codon:yes stop_codon:yes gene_type:complete
MNDINIKGTVKTPAISFCETEKRLVIEGRSTLENPARFYKPLISKLKDFNNGSIERLEIDFKLEYFNTTSSLVILDVLKHLQSLNAPDNEVVINWYYDEEDEDLLEIGQDYSTMLNFPFNLVVNPN